ncbi:F-box/FBD/LRR-repeat protein At1g13570 [Lactuca sativa]|nr:F-box/FBD/LRR-repeat protein At1g13570 [Lactuca sativa]
MDRISTLPQGIIEKILTLMPLQDAVKTSILSRKWRYCWTSMPKLTFTVLNLSSDSKEVNKHKLLKDIFHVFILHTGPLLEFCIYINNTEIANEIDPIILHLSRTKNIKKFKFVKILNDCYKLPLSFFSLQGLEHLDLTGCVVNPPLIFNGFSMLRSLCFSSCIITVEVLLQFLTHCPLLEEFTLVLYDVTHYIELQQCTFVELFKCLSSVQVLKLSRFCIEDFDADGSCMPHKLPTPLVYLRVLVLDVCFLQEDEIYCLLCLINSSPNLEKINLEMCWDHDECGEQNFNKLFDLEDHLDLKLDHLKELEITSFYNVGYEMEFVKLIMAKSPVLKLARIKLNPNVSVDEEIKMFQDLVRLPFPRASPTANFIIERMPFN